MPGEVGSTPTRSITCEQPRGAGSDCGNTPGIQFQLPAAAKCWICSLLALGLQGYSRVGAATSSREPQPVEKLGQPICGVVCVTRCYSGKSVAIFQKQFDIWALSARCMCVNGLVNEAGVESLMPVRWDLENPSRPDPSGVHSYRLHFQGPQISNGLRVFV